MKQRVLTGTSTPRTRRPKRPVSSEARIHKQNKKAIAAHRKQLERLYKP